MQGRWCGPHLSQVLLTERTVGVVVQAALQTLQTEGVAAGRHHRLIKQPAGGDTGEGVTVRFVNVNISEC